MPAGKNLACYIPEIFMPLSGAGTYYFNFHLQYPNCYTNYLGPSYNNPWMETSIPFTATAPPSASYPTVLDPVASFIQDPAGFYAQRFVG